MADKQRAAVVHSEGCDVLFDDDMLVPPAAAADAHLLDSDFNGELPEFQQKHLAECGWCRQRYATANGHPDLSDEEGFLAAVRARMTPDAQAAMREVTTLSPPLRSLTTEAVTREDVQPGQLWRLRWNNSTELAFVLDINRWWVTVAPVTTDVDAASEYDVLLSPQATALGVAAAVCVSLECVVPLFTFDRPVPSVGGGEHADQPAPATLPPAAVMREVWRAWRQAGSPPPDLTYGWPVSEGDLDRQELRNVVAEGFVPLIGASAVAPDESGQQSARLTEMLTALGLPPSQLVARSGLQIEVFLRIRQGGRIQDAEAPALARLLDTDVATVLAANPPLDEELVVQISRPLWRAGLRRRAQRNERTEDEERWDLAGKVAGLRRRTVTTAQDPRKAVSPAQPGLVDWESLVRMQLQPELDALSEAGEAETRRSS